jgi:hypothetical protein
MMRHVGYPDFRRDPAWLARLVDAMETVVDGQCSGPADTNTRNRLMAYLGRGEPIGIVPADDTVSHPQLTDLTSH